MRGFNQQVVFSKFRLKSNVTSRNRPLKVRQKAIVPSKNTMVFRTSSSIITWDAPRFVRYSFVGIVFLPMLRSHVQENYMFLRGIFCYTMTIF
mmetsp:Transcript_64472/g.131156  ORF Transcript_64472/g.131156 Transcript_64472/m.131156 type:complete len:93 (-) Transcript_64472:1512-1790(-)